MYKCTSCVCLFLQRLEESIRFPETRVTDHFKLQYRCGKSDMGSSVILCCSQILALYLLNKSSRLLSDETELYNRTLYLGFREPIL